MTLTKSGAQSARALLDHLLDRPSPLALIASLSAETVLRLIARVGLEDLGDVLSLLSTEQLSEVFDQDLWQSSRPGEDARFDAQRFSLWLALWVAESPALAAQKLRELDFDLVALGLSQQLLVLDMDRLGQSTLLEGYSQDDEQRDKALETSLYHELEQYRVVAREAQSFDALLAVLVELNTHDYSFLCALLERCADLSADYIEDNGGLCEVLSAAQTIEADVAGEREERRERRGFVAPSSALAFLKLARDTPLSALLTSDGQDPLTRAHFRALESAEAVRAGGPARAVDLDARPRTRREPGAGTAKLPERAGAAAETRLIATLEALVADEPQALRSLPRATDAPSLLARALTDLCARDEQGYERCLLSASYLANVVLAAIGREQGLAPNEAAELAFAVCGLGADEVVCALPAARVEARGSARAQDVKAVVEQLARGGLVKLFQLGFHRMCAAREAPSTRKNRELRRLRSLLVAQGLVRNVEVRGFARARDVQARGSMREPNPKGSGRVARGRGPRA